MKGSTNSNAAIFSAGVSSEDKAVMTQNSVVGHHAAEKSRKNTPPLIPSVTSKFLFIPGIAVPAHRISSPGSRTCSMRSRTSRGKSVSLSFICYAPGV